MRARYERATVPTPFAIDPAFSRRDLYSFPRRAFALIAVASLQVLHKFFMVVASETVRRWKIDSAYGENVSFTVLVASESPAPVS